MASDLNVQLINISVTGLQNSPIANIIPTDGYVLKFVDGYWRPEPQVKQQKEYFTNDGYWECPSDVYFVRIVGCGGGGCGGSGSPSDFIGGGGGGGAIEQSATISVTPGYVYDVVIGAGGVPDLPINYNGKQTQFKHSGTVLFAAMGASAGEYGGNYVSGAGVPGGSNYGIEDTNGFHPPIFGFGPSSGGPSNYRGNPGYLATYRGGWPGSVEAEASMSGGGGGAGPQGNGGNGGVTEIYDDFNMITIPAEDGESAAPNSGAGGGAGGGSPNGNNGTGGNGGSGYLYVYYTK